VKRIAVDEKTGSAVGVEVRAQPCSVGRFSIKIYSTTAMPKQLAASVPESDTGYMSTMLLGSVMGIKQSARIH
jgi:hypothetical protein